MGGEERRYPCGAREWAWLGSECASWCCQQCLVFISWPMVEPMWRTTARFRGVIHLRDQWGSPSASVGSVVFFFWTAQKKNSLGRAHETILSCCRAAKHRVCVICCIRRCLSGWMLCLRWVSVFIWCWCELCACCRVSVAFFFFFLSQNGWQAEEGGRRGTECSSAPTTRHRLECALSSWLWCWDAGVRKWVVSVLDRHVEWVTWSASPCFSGDVGPLYESGCGLTEEVDARDGGCWVEMLSACICLSPFAGKTLVNASQPCRDHFWFYWEKVWVNVNCSFDLLLMLLLAHI